MARRRQVLLLIETSNAYARGLLEGITAYVRENGPWSLRLPELHRGAPPPAWLRSWRGDGVLARIETEEIAATVRRIGLPTVDVSAARRVPELPWVETDDEAIGRLAASHFRERGFRNFAFCGESRFNWSVWRQTSFLATLQAGGDGCAVLDLPESAGGDDGGRGRQKRLTAWLAGLPRPVGIWACYDILAQQVLDAARELDIAVPEEAAVLGVDNDRLLCDLCDPPLSSVAPDAVGAGRAAAELLDRMLHGESVPPAPRLVPPVGVVTRQSTDILAVEDPDVARAVRYLRAHACEGISVADVLKSVPLSRRVLEFRFRKCLGKTPHALLLHYRLEKAKELLRETELPLEAIARRSGFAYAEYFSVAFRKHLGRTPGAYRREVRLPRPGHDEPPEA